MRSNRENLRPLLVFVNKRAQAGIDGGFFYFPSLPFPSLPSLSLLVPPLRSRAPVNQLGGLRERCKLPQRGPEQNPGQKRIWENDF